MKIKIDKSKCIGCGTCNVLYEELFKMNDAGEVNVVEIDESKIDMEKLNDVIKSCPNGSISIDGVKND